MGRTKIKKVLLALVLVIIGLPVPVAAQLTSPSYRVDETFFGTGGELNACGSAYCANQAAGETAVGHAGSTNFGIQAGFNTTDAPYLEFNVAAANINIGTLSTSSATTTTATFYVRSYLASGYTIVSVANPPSNGSHTLTALASQTASSPGTEQFGINLKANTSPTTFGADPSQYPDSTFGFGIAATGYDTLNVYKYVKNDIIAKSLSSSGRTDYTISYLFNISSVTPNGVYTLNHDLVAVATF
ncbi:MAG TPA: hypothetical protein VLE74_03105 [Candidatus Saccharimonadales bacterium]|nr:hypothetical protein [Candidatus Saccharimonadales bacterium]